MSGLTPGQTDTVLSVCHCPGDLGTIPGTWGRCRGSRPALGCGGRCPSRDLGQSHGFEENPGIWGRSREFGICPGNFGPVPVVWGGGGRSRIWGWSRKFETNPAIWGLPREFGAKIRNLGPILGFVAGPRNLVSVSGI